MIITHRTLPVNDLIAFEEKYKQYGVNLFEPIRNMKMYNEFSRRKSANDWPGWENFAYAHCLSVIQAKRIIYKLVKQFPLEINKTNNPNVNTTGNTASSTKSIRRFTKRNHTHC